MKINRLRYVFSGLAVLFLIVSCAKSPNPAPEYKSRHTLIMYILGDSDYYMRRALDNNIADAKYAVNSASFPSNGHIYVLHDKVGGTVLYEIVKTSVDKEQVRLLKDYNECNALDPDNMANIMRDIKTINDSRNEDVSEGDYYGIVLSSHGTGWLPPELNNITSHPAPSAGTGHKEVEEHDLESLFFKPGNSLTRAFGNDNYSTGTPIFMSIPDLAEGLSPIHFDYMLFDACFMSSVEVLYEMRNNADYIIASPAEVLMAGFPYKEVIPALFDNNGGTIEEKLKSASNSFVNYYLTTNPSSATVAVIDMDKLDELALSVREILNGEENAGFDLNSVQVLEHMYSRHIFFDFEDYLKARFSSAPGYKRFEEALGEAVVFERHTPKVYSAVPYSHAGLFDAERICGMTVYVPREQFPTTRAAWLETSWAKAIGAE